MTVLLLARGAGPHHLRDCPVTMNVPLCQSRLLSSAAWGFVGRRSVGADGRLRSKIPHRRPANWTEQFALSRDSDGTSTETEAEILGHWLAAEIIRAWKPANPEQEASGVSLPIGAGK